MNQDAYGMEIKDYYYKRNQYLIEIGERSDNRIIISPGPKQYFAGYNKWTRREKEAIKYAKGKILDVGCGAGRHLLYLKRKGFKVLGLDSSKLAIEICRKRGLNESVVKNIDMVNESLGKYSTILMLGANMGLFGSKEKMLKILSVYDKMVTNRGRIIAESVDPYMIYEDEIEKKYIRSNIKSGRMPGQWRIRIRYENIIGKWFDYLFLSKKELHEILNLSVWEIEHIIQYDEPIYIAVLKKKVNNV